MECAGNFSLEGGICLVSTSLKGAASPQHLSRTAQDIADYSHSAHVDKSKHHLDQQWFFTVAKKRQFQCGLFSPFPPNPQCNSELSSYNMGRRGAEGVNRGLPGFKGIYNY